MKYIRSILLSLIVACMGYEREILPIPPPTSMVNTDANGLTFELTFCAEGGNR